MTQFYIIEIQQYTTGEFGHIVHFAWDENADQARLKAESKYHEVLAAAAVSNLPSHAAALISSDGYPVLHQCYKHDVEIVPVAEEPEPVQDEGGEEPAPEEEPGTEEVPEEQPAEETPEEQGSEPAPEEPEQEG